MDSRSTFVKRFGDLIALLRVDPGNDAAQDLALTAATAAVESDPVEVEAGVEWSVIPDDLTLKGRLLARRVEAIRIAAGAEPHELLALARALSHDHVPVPSSPNVTVTMVEELTPPPSSPVPPSRPERSQAQPRRDRDRRAWQERRRPGRAQHPGFDRRRGPDRRGTGERRLYLIAAQRDEIDRLHDALARDARELAWEAVLATSATLVRLVPRVPASDRRTYGIQVRRAIPRPAVEAIVDLATRDPTVRGHAADVLRWVGVDAAEAILDRLVHEEAAEVKGFYYEVLCGIPAAYPLMTALLGSHHPDEVRHAAALLGRLGQPAAVTELASLLTHSDDSIRVAAVRAIGELHDGPASEPLRRALQHPDGRTRAAAAGAIATWRGGVLALLLVGALETERDRDAWPALVSALGRMGTVESSGALAGVALARRGLLRQGYSSGQRLAAVEALGLSDSPPALTTLERLARDAEGVVRYAAERMLHAERHAG